MKTYSAIFLLTIISIISCYSPKTEFSIAPIFSNKMVLQQAQSNAVWGTSAPLSKITLTSSWGEQVVTQTNDSGSWNLQLPTPAYNKSINTEGLSFTVSDGNSTIEINDILVGEVWLASGQSNMQWFMNQCDGCVINQDEEITNSTNDMIRMFSVPQDLTGESIKFRKWLSANPENTGSFSATAYYFAKNLHDKLDMPIGIVNTSWGGTRVEAWMSPQKLNSLNETKNLHQKNNHFSKIQIKEFSILFIMINYLNVASKKIEDLSEITFLSEKNESLKKLIIEQLIEEHNKSIIHERINIKYKELVREINENSSIQIILKAKDEEAILDSLNELLLELKELSNLRKIESLEKKLINNLDESSYTELIKLKNQLNRE